MTSIHMRDVPATSRSLPPVPLLDRGRAKTRLNTDPDAYANLRTPSGTLSISLPPIRPSVRGSKDEGCGPLPGISSIMDQSEIPYEHTRPARRLSESSPRGYPASPRDWDLHSPMWTPRQTRMDSISTATDGSRPSSPDLSALSSSTSSLSSERTGSPGPIPRFALGSRLPPLGSAFELSDLRTSLPSDDRRGGPSRTPVYRSPRSTPLPLSRPMSPAIQLSPRMLPLTRRLRSLAVTVEEDRMDRYTDSPPREIERASPSIKSEPETDSVPSSPRDKGISETDLAPHDEVLARSMITEMDPEQVPSEQRDEHMACTPTQPDPKLPVPWMDTEPSTPTNRSPLVRSPSIASSTTEEEDSKPIKQSESETEEEEEESYAERRAKKRAGPVDAASVRTRGGNFDWFSSGYPLMPMHPPELQHLAQEAGRLGFKLQADPTRQPATSQSQVLLQMAERQQRIEQLQQEQEEAAASIRWGLEQQYIPEFAPPPLPIGLTAPSPIGLTAPPPPMVPPPLPPSIVAPQNVPFPDPVVPELQPPLDYSYAYTDLAPTPTGLTDPYSSLSSLSPPSLSATSASSPSDNFSWPSPPSLPTYAMPPTTRSTFKAQEANLDDEYLKTLLQGSSPPGGVPATGSGTHKCQSCGKTFRRPSGLKDHMNIHSGEKPYCCPLETCRKGFATRSNMIRHHNKTHPNRPKIGGVADIGADTDDIPELDSAEQGSSSQGRFRVVQQAGGKEVPAGVGPVRGTKERRTMRKGAPSVVG